MPSSSGTDTAPARRKRPPPGAVPGPPTPPRPRDGTLAEFVPLLPAEKILLECCRSGEFATIATDLPGEETDSRRVRASFVRLLAIGADEEAAVHEHGVQLRGAWLVGPLDFDSAELRHPLVLWQCAIERVEARQARLKLFALRGSRIAGRLGGDGLRCSDDLRLDDGFEIAGEARLLGVHIEGDLACAGGTFLRAEGAALACDRAVVLGEVQLRDGFRAAAEVRLHGAQIGGNLDCGDGRFEGKTGRALSCDVAIVSGDVFLSDGFHASGVVRLLGMKIGGNLDCSGGRFENPRGVALSCDSTTVGRGLFLRGNTRIEGGVDLSSMTVARLCDDEPSWAATTNVILHGFTYLLIASASPMSARGRIAWLERQSGDHLGVNFMPQPWEHLASVLRVMGHPEEAREVAIAKHIRMRAAGRYVGGSRTWDWLYGNLVGYGYRPWKLLRIVLAVWIGCVLAYWPAANPALFGLETHLLEPTRSEPEPDCLLRAAAGGTPPCRARKPSYQDLFLPAFSAEVMIPVISLGYRQEWKPIVSTRDGRPLYWGWVIRLVYWFEIMFGWLASLLLIAAVGNLVKKE